MDSQEIMHYWYYFCSLCERLETTRQYVDHSAALREGRLKYKNGTAYSNAFLQILLLASAEFENISKLLCKIAVPKFEDEADILEITKIIQENYLGIKKTQVHIDSFQICPLEEWRIETIREKDGEEKEVVRGLSWWTAHNELKHQRFFSFRRANLQNCVYALASLLVLELCLSEKVLGGVSNLSAHGCPYFHFSYGHQVYRVRSEHDLPNN